MLTITRAYEATMVLDGDAPDEIIAEIDAKLVRCARRAAET